MLELPECEENGFDGLHCPRYYGGSSCSYCGAPQPKAEPHPCRWFNGKCIDCGRSYGAPRGGQACAECAAQRQSALVQGGPIVCARHRGVKGCAE